MSRWNDPSPGAVRIKICGVTEPIHIDAAAAAGADAIGLVRVPSSPRYVDAEQARSLAAHAPSSLEVITLLVDPDEDTCATRSTSWVQLHGAERPDLIKFASRSGPVIRGLSAGGPSAGMTLHEWDAYPSVSRILLDGPQGGSGRPFDHAAMAPIARELTTPWILAGGLTIDCVNEAITQLRPWGVDVSSGVESARGQKDPDLITAFCERVRSG